ncbi:protein of unknown function DUF227 [Kipferlia bialata]|uniref:Aminoglycoside phosphotransferase domain-containing protein n=1 Tax=Kipferlia bialata TaxID=797122 RepID=A0A9K3CVY6_9EUKA|nr:protein of unknown function DUF227 [Kipferlia bialata]|eukprot:g4982.t1
MYDSIVSCTIPAKLGGLGLAGQMFVVTATMADGETVDLVLKTSPAGARMAATREVDLYDAVRKGTMPEVAKICPMVLTEEADYETGEIKVLMENLVSAGCLGVNFICGNQIWGMSDEQKAKIQDSTFDVVEGAFVSAARMHAATWNDPEIMAQGWLKGVSFFDGTGKEAWEKAIFNARYMWNKGKARFESEEQMTLSPKLLKLMDDSLAAASFQDMNERVTDPSTPYALCHGDFHASNMFLRPKTEGEEGDVEKMADRIVMVDWSEVGVWEPTTDLAQMIVSDTKPEIMERTRELLESYHAALIRYNPAIEAEYPMDKCWERFCLDGASRWVWLFAMLTGFPMPPAALQYFHDQFLRFVELHGDHPIYPLGQVVL